MNGRIYDPILGQFMQADNYVQTPEDFIGYDRYNYCRNNPFKYTDPNGEFFVTAAIIGATFGAYTGYKIGESKGAKGMAMAGYILGGAAIGGLSGHVGAAVASSGGFMANTASIMAGSYSNSLGMTYLSGGDMATSISFGVASFNLGTGEWKGLSSSGNSWLETFGYTMGALGNFSDLLAGSNPGKGKLRTEYDTELRRDINYVDENGNIVGSGQEPYKDIISHSQFSDKRDNILIDWGPKYQKVKNFEWLYATNSYEEGKLIRLMIGDPIIIRGINMNRISEYSTHLNKGGMYNVALSSCVTKTSNALNMAGALNIGYLHPFVLHGQMYLRSIGVRASSFSYHTINNKWNR